MLPVRFEPTTPASGRPQTYALDRAVTGIGVSGRYRVQISSWRPAILTHTPCGFPPSMQANSGYSLTKPWLQPSMWSVVNYWQIPRFDSVWPQLLTASLKQHLYSGAEQENHTRVHRPHCERSLYCPFSFSWQAWNKPTTTPQTSTTRLF
jgi:hypothetical protein